MPPVRRLAAILAADVAGYSRLMGVDEEGTHERLQGHLRDVIEPKITGAAWVARSSDVGAQLASRYRLGQPHGREL